MNPDSLYENEEQRKQHLSAIQTSSKKSLAGGGDHPSLLSRLQEYEKEAKVKTFLPILISKRVKDDHRGFVAITRRELTKLWCGKNLGRNCRSEESVYEFDSDCRRRKRYSGFGRISLRQSGFLVLTALDGISGWNSRSRNVPTSSFLISCSRNRRKRCVPALKSNPPCERFLSCAYCAGWRRGSNRWFWIRAEDYVTKPFSRENWSWEWKP